MIGYYLLMGIYSVSTMHFIVICIAISIVRSYTVAYLYRHEAVTRTMWPIMHCAQSTLRVLGRCC